MSLDGASRRAITNPAAQFAETLSEVLVLDPAVPSLVLHHLHEGDYRRAETGTVDGATVSLGLHVRPDPTDPNGFTLTS